MKWTVSCSDCEKFLALKSSQKFPEKCPHCGAIFEVPVNREVESEDGEHTFIPPAEKYLDKLKNL